MKFIVVLLFGIIFQSSFAAERFIAIDGPNCLNGALVATGVLPYQRYTSNSEMWVKLKSSMCKKVKNKERQRGDIGILLDFGPFATPNIISHAFVYLNDLMSYEKRGYGKTEPYHTLATMDILNSYDLDDIEGESVEFYRCENWLAFQSAQKINLSKKLEAALNETLKLEKMLHQSIKSEDAHFSLVKNQIFKIAKQMTKLPLTSAEIIFSKDIAARLVSISSQLNALGDSELRGFTQKWEFQEKGINDVFFLLSEIPDR